MNKLELIKQVIDDKLGKDITVIEVDKSTSVADYFVIATGNTKNHTQAMADAVTDKMEELGFEVLGQEGLREGNWILVDLGDIIVHIFTQDNRNYYNLERLWEKNEPQES